MADKKRALVGKSAGQRVPPLINVIISTLRNYPDGSQILKELIQNADDAHATEIHFLLDETHHGTEFLIHPDVAKYQGPALYSWNNAVFDDEDWEGIQNISMSHKEKKLLKVGRFALGFISVYHITDFPCILSNDSVLLLDPHMVIDRTGGLLIGLDEFTSDATVPNIKNHLDCFNGYFGYNGSDRYDGTIFRFPLRSGVYKTSLPNNIYDSKKVLESLFDPFKNEIENCLLFMKNLNVIRVSVKDHSGLVRLLYSAEITPVVYRDRLGKLRQKIFEFVQNEKYLRSSSIFISICPIYSISQDLSRTLKLWLVINMLGLPDSVLESAYRKLSDSYLPWVAIALPLPHSEETFPCLKYGNCWSLEFDNIIQIFNFIEMHLPTIKLSNEIFNFIGNVFCFLPIAASSNFPFHVQGYFALSTNRRSIKWPRYDDMSDEAKWNKHLVASLSTICYAVLVYFSVSKFQCEYGITTFIYNLWSCLPPASEHDQLQAVLHKGALSLLQNQPLAFTTNDTKWCLLESANFLPSPFNNCSINHEKTCNELLIALSESVVEVPDNIAKVLVYYQFLKSKVKIISPNLIRQLLLTYKEEERLIYFLRDKDNVISLLEVVLSDLNYSSRDISSKLNGIQLIPKCNSELPHAFGSSNVFISNTSQKIMKLFPGLENLFVEPELPSHIYSSLLMLSKTENVNIINITNLRSQPEQFYQFLNCSIKSQFDMESDVKWTPGANDQPERQWIECVWKFINEESSLIENLERHKLPIFPKQNVSSASEIDLLPLSTNTMPYLKLSGVKDHSKIESMLASSGCHLCYKNQFILNYSRFVISALPKGLFPILRLTNIRENFISKLSTADNPTRQSLIKIVLSSEPKVNDLVILKLFPIFISISNLWIKIDGYRQCIIPHNSIPKEISFYPMNFLSPFHMTNLNLCSLINIHPLSLDDTVLQYLLPLIVNGDGKNVPSQRDTLTLWIFKNSLLLNPNTVTRLSTAKWLCDSTVNPNPMSIPKLYSPVELYDPQDKHLCRLLSKELQGIFPNVIYKEYYQILRNMGMQSCANITLPKLSAIITIILRKVPSIGYPDWLNSLLHLLSLHFDKIENNNLLWNVFKQNSFLLPSSSCQCSSYPTFLPFFTHLNAFCKPQEVTLCSQNNSSLIAGVTPVLIMEPNKMEKYKKIYKCMGVRTIISPELVCKQLTLIVTAFANSNSNVSSIEVQSLVNKIYKFLGQLLLSNPNILRYIQLPNDCIFIQNLGFLCPDRFALSCDGCVFPYIISVDKHYILSDGNLSAFFNYLNVDSYLSFNKCQFILNQLRSNNLSKDQVNLALSVIQYSHKIAQHEFGGTREYYILAQNSMIYPAGECIFNDLPWLKRSDISTSKAIVHLSISNQIASDFGCLPASTALVPTAQCISYTSAVACGQSEDIVARLNGLLKGYRMHMDVFNELIQNSDDAGANTVKILFDYTTHSFVSVLDPSVKDIHGPALYFYNDSMFSAKDFESILKLSSGNKLKSTDKIGRFGIGFNAVYNFTDCPSFVSDRYVQIFDPLQKYSGPYIRSSGVRFTFVDDPSTAIYNDQFKVYDGLFDCKILNKVPYEYTLFRLPFRLTPSNLSRQTFLCDDIVKIQELVVQEISQTMLFLQNVVCIEIYERTAAGIKLLQTVTKTDCKTTHFIQNNIRYFHNYLKLVNRPNIISSSDTVSIISESETEHSKQDFLISYASGTFECFDVLKRFKASSADVTFLPLCGVAIPLQYLEHTPDKPMCGIYTFLPLPIKSPLFFNINGYFSLSDSRKNLCDAIASRGNSNNYQDLPTEWNMALINDALPNALICAISSLTKINSTNFYNNYSSLWTTTSSTELLWKSFPQNLAKRIMQSSACIFSCAQYPTKWVAFSDISFLSLELSLKMNNNFIQCIYKLFIQKGIKLANVSHTFFSTDVYRAFSSLAPQKIFDLKRVIETVISPDLHKMSLSQIIIIMKAITPLCIHTDKQWLFTWLSKTEFIPCGVGSDNFKLKLPCKVVCRDTKISDLYHTREMRHPVPELHQMFTFNHSNDTTVVLQRLGVISHSLPECEIIERCQITENLEIELAKKHSFHLIEYLYSLREDSDIFISVYPKIQSIRFIPTYTDEITSVLSSPVPPFAAPRKCYSFCDHHLVTPIYSSACSEVRETAEVLKLFHNPQLDVVFHVLNTLIAQADKFRDVNIDDKITAIYQYISSSDSRYLSQIENELNGKQWIWEPDIQLFYASDQVIISPYLMSISKNKYLVSFPYREVLKNRDFESFLIKVGIKKVIDDETIIACCERIYNDFTRQPVDPNLIEFILKLIESIQDFANCSEKVFILSQLDILHRPNVLYVNFNSHLSSFLNEECYSSCIVKHQIHPLKAFLLGARPCEELFCTNDLKFGLTEEITDRIKGLIREMPIESVFKELIQNAEDAKATEMVFILDDQDYSANTKSLVDNICPNWKDLHSYPSLNVYNNKGFSEDDIKGIQALSVGGKRNDRNTIGKFGLGFNSVYHITSAPTFVSTQLGKQELLFCCFDPFLKYTYNPLIQQVQSKRGLRRIIPFENTDKFSDQLFPFKYEKFRSNDTINESLANIRKNKEFTMFRFPLDIKGKPETDNSIQDTPYENTRTCYSLENLEKELLKVIKSYPDILLFLNHLCSLKVLKIDRNRNVTLLSSVYIKPRKPIMTELPSWFPLKDSTFVKIQEKENKSDKQKWLIYSIPDIPIDKYVNEDPSLADYSLYYSNEKLSGYGAVAVRISNFKNCSNYSNLFTFLPVGSKADFPVHINAPLILDSPRQSVHHGKNDWEDKWHYSIIKRILVPLYTMLLLDLRDPRTVAMSINEKLYFTWYYSLFPSTDPKNMFLSEIMNTLYEFLCEVNPEILLADNLVSDIRIWYPLKGTNRGIFKPSSFFKLPSSPEIGIDRTVLRQIHSNHDLRECEIKKSLILIKFPLTFAPLRLSCLFKSSTLNPITLLSYLSSNQSCLFRENAASNTLESMVLKFPQLLTLLEYILTDSKDYLSKCKIPLRIDLNNNLCDFDTHNPSFIPTFSSLLPHCAEHFISLEYTREVIGKLFYIGYVRELDSDYLAEHLEIESSSKCLIFWEYVLINKIDKNGLTKFGNHLLLPVYDGSSQIIYYPISKLKFLLTSSLQQEDEILFSAMNKLGCPHLHFESFKRPNLCSSNTINFDTFLTKIKDFLGVIAISTSRPSNIILGSIEHSTLTSAELELTESSKLRTLFSTLVPAQLSNDQLRKFSTLKIFLSINSKCFSLEELDICFVNDHRIPIDTKLFHLLYEKHKLIILEPTFVDLRIYCQKLRKEFLDVSRLFTEYIFRYLSTLPFDEQNSLISFIAGKLAENKIDYLPNLIDNLKQISFILSADNVPHKVSEFYCSNLRFIRTFLPNYSLPENWGGENLRSLFLKLGLQTSVPLDKILFVATGFSRRNFVSEKLRILFEEFARILQNVDHFETRESDIIQRISRLKFLPVWKYDIINLKDLVSPTLARFSEAQLYENRHCCCCASWVHKYPMNLPVSSYEILNIHTIPPLNVVIQHLLVITKQILQQNSPPTQIPECFEIYFRSSYEYFECLLASSDISLVDFHDTRCILWERQLFYPINMLFTTSQGLAPFIRQVPSELSHFFSKFLVCIGVKQTADYTHYSYVLKEIRRSLSQRNEHFAGSSYVVQSNIVFDLFIKSLRSSNNEINLDLKSTLVLTRHPKLIPCSTVVYADNQALLSRVTKVNIDINLLKTLEPDDSNSCVPPVCLELKKLSDVISEEVDPIVFRSYKIENNTSLAIYLEKRINDPLFYRILRRLFYHLTKKDLNDLNQGGVTIQDLLNNLEVVSVQQIDIIIMDKRQTPARQYSLENACSCYIYINYSTFLLSDHHTMRDCIFKDIAFYLNTYLREIFTEVLSHLELCLELTDFFRIMEKLSEFNIEQDPWELPRELVETNTPRNTHPHSNFSNNYHLSSGGTRFQPPRPEGISLGEPDPSAASLSLNVSQCNLLAARHLITPIPPTNLIFPALACFLSFEALINIFHAILHFAGSRNRLTTERNLRVYLNLISQIFHDNKETYEEIHMLTCSLMDYDFDTRYPSATLIHYIPQQLYSLDQANEAIKNVNQIIKLVTDTFPDLRNMLVSPTHKMFSCSTAPSSPQLIRRLPCIDMYQGVHQVALETDSTEFAAITRRFHQSMPYATVFSITSIINPFSWSTFENNILQELPRFPNICQSIRLLFHGSSKTDPEVIIKDPAGFNMKFADRGLWGHGIYFAVSSSYAHRYSFKIANEKQCIFAVSVLIGHSKQLPQNRSLTCPPLMPNGIDNYHSVQGIRDGELIHVVYKNSMAYPNYLITYGTHD